MKFFKHLKTINHHKWLVMKHCFKAGLYKQGLLHDMSKYSPTEFWAGVKYYQGTRSPNDAEREDNISDRSKFADGIAVIHLRSLFYFSNHPTNGL